MKRLPVFLAVLLALSLFSMSARAEETATVEDLIEKSGAEELFDSLGSETKELLSSAGVEGFTLQPEGDGLFSALSQAVREKLLGPIKALAALIAVIVLCSLGGCLDRDGAGGVAAFAGALACASLVVTPLLQVMRSTARAVEGASAFLLAAVPVYGGLMTASGSPAAGASYSFLTLAAGNVIPILSSAVIFPALQIFLALAFVSCVSKVNFRSLAGSLYSFAKWLLVLAVTVFSGVLSVQTALNAQVDAATNKAAKLAVSAAVPIVGGAFGDAVAAIRNSVRLVKSGAGAFGILAALCIFAPTAIEALLWSLVCGAGRLAADLFDAPGLSSFFGMCASAAKMVLAVIASTCAVCVVSAAILLFVGGSG